MAMILIPKAHLSRCLSAASTLRLLLMLEAGGLDGLAVWKRIIKAAKELLKDQPDRPVH